MDTTTPPTSPEPAAAPRFWGRERTTGQLFSAAFGMFGAHKRWLIPLVATGVVPGLACSLIAQDLFGYNSQVLVSRMMGLRLPGMMGLEAGPSTETMLLMGLLSAVVLTLSTIFVQAGMLGTLAEAGRGRPISLGLAFEQAAKGFGRYLATALWVGLRLLPWMLLFFVPGIIKGYAWMFALPARMAGDVRGAEESIQLSTSATHGRKAYLFLFNFLMALIIMGISLILGIFAGVATVAAMRSGGGPSAVQQIVQVLNTFVGGFIGVVIQLGVWLAYADAVARYNPESPAAAYALGVSGKPFPPPNFRRD